MRGVGKNFTLIELLIVISIIAILAGMLLPALNRAREKGRAISCSNIVRQLRMTVSSYEDDNGEILMPAYLEEGSNIPYWMKLLSRSGYWDNRGFWDADKKMPKQFECPSEQRIRTSLGNTVEHPVLNYADTYDYGLNVKLHRIAKPEDGTYVRQKKKIYNPSRLSSIMDGKNYILEGLYEKYDLQITNRHGTDRGNVAFMDGHVENMMIPFKRSGSWYGFPFRLFWENTTSIYKADESIY